MLWERTLPYGGLPYFLWAQPVPRRRAQSIPYPLFYLDLGVPLLLLGHAVHWESMLPFQGVPPFILARAVRCGRARSVPLPLLPAHGVRPLLGGG